MIDELRKSIDDLRGDLTGQPSDVAERALEFGASIALAKLEGRDTAEDEVILRGIVANLEFVVRSRVQQRFAEFLQRVAATVIRTALTV